MSVKIVKKYTHILSSLCKHKKICMDYESENVENTEQTNILQYPRKKKVNLKN